MADLEAAKRRLLDATFEQTWMTRPYAECAAAIDEFEREARAAALAEVRKRLAALGSTRASASSGGFVRLVTVNQVLAILDDLSGDRT